MRAARLIVLVVALGAGLVAAMLALNLTKREPPAPAPAAVILSPATVDTEDVLVAARNLPLGTTLQPDDLSWQEWPSEAITASYITRSSRPAARDELVGTLVRTAMLSGEPINQQKIVDGGRGFLSAILPAGMRAVAVRVNAASTAGGFILPNDRVDVILVTPSGNGYTSQTLLTNVRVLAIDQIVDEGEGEQAVVAQDTATLELSPDDAELLIGAQQTGTVTLTLRSIADANGATTRTADAGELADGAEEPPPPEPTRTGVDVFRFGVPSRISAAP